MFFNLRALCTYLMTFVGLVTHRATDTECPIVTSHNDRRTNKNTLRIMQYNVE